MQGHEGVCPDADPADAGLAEAEDEGGYLRIQSMSWSGLLPGDGFVPLVGEFTGESPEADEGEHRGQLSLEDFDAGG